METHPEPSTHPRVALVFDEALHRVPPGWRHGPRPARMARLWKLISQAEWLDAWPYVATVKPAEVSEEVLGPFHPAHYVQTVQAVSTGQASLLDSASCGLNEEQVPVFPGMHEIFLRHVAAVLAAADVLLEGRARRAFTPAGGYHLVRPAEARGFGVYNDVVLCLLRLREAGWRVAYVSLDAHHADAVQAAFWEDPHVLTVSVHEGPEFRFPGSGFPDEVGTGEGEGYTVNVPLPPGAGDEHVLWAFEQVVVPVLERFAPDAVVVQVGGGLHASDPLGHTRLTTRGFWALWDCVAPLAPHWLIVGGGGFSVEAPVRLWALAVARLAEQSVAADERLPTAYRQLWGGTTYHDAVLTPLKADMDAYVWHYIRHQVARAKASLFPYHQLTMPEGVKEAARLLYQPLAAQVEVQPNARFPMVAEPQRVVPVPVERDTEGDLAVVEGEEGKSAKSQPEKKWGRRSRRRKRSVATAANQRAPSAEQERDAAASRRRRRRRSRRRRKRRK